MRTLQRAFTKSTMAGPESCVLVVKTRSMAAASIFSTSTAAFRGSKDCEEPCGAYTPDAVIWHHTSHRIDVARFPESRYWITNRKKNKYRERTTQL